MAEEKIMWGYIWDGEHDASDSVTLCDSKEEAIEDAQASLRMDYARFENVPDYYLVKVEKIERFRMPEMPAIEREEL